MGAHRQPDRPSDQSQQAGPPLTQTVVELLSASHSGLIFWSRHQFEITAELQLRLHSRAVKGAPWLAALQNRQGWLLLRGFVVQCKPSRRTDGTVGFQISIVFDPAFIAATTAPGASKKLAAIGPVRAKTKVGLFGLN